MLSEPVLQVVRRELKRISPDIKVEIEDIKQVIESEVLKREVVEGELAEAARKKITRSSTRALRTRYEKSDTEIGASVRSTAQPSQDSVE